MPIGGLLAGGFAGVLIHRFGSGRLAVAIGTVLRAAPGPRRPRAVVARAGGLVPRPRRARRDDGRRGERARDRGPAAATAGRSCTRSTAGGAPARCSVARWAPIAAAAGDPGRRGPRGRRRRASRSSPSARRCCCSPTSRRTRRSRRDQPVERIHLRNAPRLLRLLGPIALLGLLGVMLEDAAQTWSTVYLVDVLGLARRDRGRRVRPVHRRDDGRPADQRPLGRPLGRRADRPLGRGAGRRRARARGAGRADGHRLDRVRRVHRRWRRRVVDVPADGRRRRLATRTSRRRTRSRSCPGWRGPGS